MFGRKQVRGPQVENEEHAGPETPANDIAGIDVKRVALPGDLSPLSMSFNLLYCHPGTFNGRNACEQLLNRLQGREISWECLCAPGFNLF
jgi:hypothetical protein